MADPPVLGDEMADPLPPDLGDPLPLDLGDPLPLCFQGPLPPDLGDAELSESELPEYELLYAELGLVNHRPELMGDALEESDALSDPTKEHSLSVGL